MSSHASPYLHHHFEDMEQQRDVQSLGLWVFLATEVMFFGGLFAALCVYQYFFEHAFVTASRQLNVYYGAFNTGVLILSSLTMAMAVHAAQTGHQKKIVRFILATLGLACVFLVVKGFEYHEKWVHHLIPGPSFHIHAHDGHEVLNAVDMKHAQLFFMLYFVMTGLHGLHVIGGMGVMVWLLVMAKKGKFTQENYMPVEVTGLYWHFVDIVWIYLFPIIYLINRHGSH